MDSLSPNEAAGRALKLWKSDAQLCEPYPKKIARISTDLPSDTSESNESYHSPSSPSVKNSISNASKNDTDDVKVLDSGSSSQSECSQVVSNKSLELPSKFFVNIFPQGF